MKTEAWKDPRNWVKNIQNILNDGIISPKLRTACEEAQKAIKVKDYKLAYQITAVKSYVCGAIFEPKSPEDKVNAFQEDYEANKRILGNSVYSTLDGIHHAIAFSINEMPSGMMLVSGNGKVTQMKSKGIHPIVRRIQYEHRMIEKRNQEREHQRNFEETHPSRRVNWKGKAHD